MVLNKLALTAALTLGAVSMAQMADQGHGKLNFTGAIINAPCSILPEILGQTINLGLVSNAALAANKNTGTSPPQSF